MDGNGEVRLVRVFFTEEWEDHGLERFLGCCVEDRLKLDLRRVVYLTQTLGMGANQRVALLRSSHTSGRFFAGYKPLSHTLAKRPALINVRFI